MAERLASLDGCFVPAVLAGDLVDALMDEMPECVSDRPEVQIKVRALVARLGNAYTPYLDHWALRLPHGHKEGTDD